MSEQSAQQSPCLKTGGWAMVDDPMKPAEEEEVDFDWIQALEDNGFEQWARIGGQRTLGAAPLQIEVYRRNTEPRFLIEVFGNIKMAAERAYAQDLPELMRLLQQWTAVAQQAAVVQLLATLPTEPDGHRESAQPDLAALARILHTGRRPGDDVNAD